MTTQDKITQIIIECAPVDTTIAQIKLMTTKLAALVDEVVSRKDSDQTTATKEQPDMVYGINAKGEMGWHKAKWVATQPMELVIDDEFEPSDDSDKCECWCKEIMQDVIVKRRYGKTQSDLLREELGDDELSARTIIDGVYAKLEKNGIWAMYGYEKASLSIPDDVLSEAIAKFCQNVGIEAIASEDMKWLWRNGKRSKLLLGDLEDMCKLARNSKPLDRIVLCDTSDGNSMFVEYDKELSHWVLYNWRTVDRECRIGLLLNIAKWYGVRFIVSDDKKYIWRNAVMSKLEDSELDMFYPTEPPISPVTKVDPSDVSLVYSDDFAPSDKHPLDPPSLESLRKMAELGIDIHHSQQRPMTICYGNDIDDMFIRHDDGRNHWALYNWRMVDVDEREKWLKEVRVKLGISVVISDDMVWIWRNGERVKTEEWKAS